MFDISRVRPILQAVPLEFVHLKKHIYADFPLCQRDYVWEQKVQNQQKLVDSVLRGLPIPPITVMRSEEVAMVGSRTWVVDGQQRLRTLLRYMDNEFRTARTLHLEPGLTPIAPGCFYCELPPDLKKRFDEYPLQFCEYVNLPPDLTGLVYRRLNYGVPLNLPERLYSYDSAARRMADCLAESEFWNLYHGDKNRKQVFIMALRVMYMEVMDIYANMTTPRMFDLVAGGKDPSLSAQLQGTILRRLSAAYHVFDGISMTSTHEIIPIYQCCLLLEGDGFTLSVSQRSCLAQWYMALKTEFVNDRRYGSETLTLLTKVNAQQEFWVRHLPEVSAMEGLARRDARRGFTQYDKLLAFERQGGKCPVCGQGITLRDVGHHVKPYAAGGATESGNCELIHTRCHNGRHVSQGQLQLSNGNHSEEE